MKSVFVLCRVAPAIILVGCATDYVIPASTDTAQIYFQDGPTLGIYANVYRDAYKCTYPEQINSVWTLASRQPNAVTGPYKLEAAPAKTITISAMNSNGYLVKSCDITFTARFEPNHSYLVKVFERTSACTVRLFDVTSSASTITDQTTPVDIRFRKHTLPWSVSRPACTDQLEEPPPAT
jgi:hypothetical protein